MILVLEKELGMYGKAREFKVTPLASFETVGQAYTWIQEQKDSRFYSGFNHNLLQVWEVAEGKRSSCLVKDFADIAYTTANGETASYRERVVAQDTKKCA